MVGPLLIFSISLLVGNSFQWPPQGGEQGPTACPMYIDPGSSRNASPAPRGSLVSPPPFEQQQQFRAPQQQQQQYAAPQQQQFNAPQQQPPFSVPQKPVASAYTEQANYNVNGLNNNSYAFPQQQQHQSFQQSQTYHQTSSIVSSSQSSIRNQQQEWKPSVQEPNSILNNNSVTRPVGATSGAAAANLAQNLASKASAGPAGQYAASPADQTGGGPGPKGPAGPTGGAGQNAPAGPGQNVSAPTRGRGVLTQQKPGMRVPMCGACDGQIRCHACLGLLCFCS